MRLGRFEAIALCLAAVTVATTAQERRLTRPDVAGRRLALVVGNNTYPTVPLTNAANDARAVDAALRGVGFTTELVTDATLETMDRAVEGFIARVQPGDVALFYYSGHGVQVDGENYLIPIDFRGTDTIALRRRTTSVSEVEERLKARGTRLRILILDACRDNPYSGARSASQGLAAYQAEGALIAYATAAGKTASDNASAANGLFTMHFLKMLATPGLSISDLFRGVREAVSVASNGRQVPWVSDGLIGNFALVPADGTGAAPPSPLGAVPPVADGDLARREELAYWESIKDSRSAHAFEEYVKRYGPSAVFAEPARLKIQELSSQPSAPQPRGDDAFERFFGRPTTQTDAVPEGQQLDVRLLPPLSSASAQPGDRFEVLTVVDLRSGNRVLVPAGTSIIGGVQSVEKATNRRGNGSLMLSFDLLMINGDRSAMRARVVQVLEGDAAKRSPGSIIAGILGGSGGAAVGLLVRQDGAIVSATPGKEVVLTAGTILRIQLDSAVAVR